MIKVISRRDFMKGMMIGGVAAGSAGILAACGSSSSESSGSAGEATEAEVNVTDTTDAAETEASESVGTSDDGDILVVEMWTNDASKEAVMTELIENYNETTGMELGIELQMTVTSELGTMLTLAYENNELPLLTIVNAGLIYEEGGANYPVSYLPGGQEFLDEWENKTSEYGEYNKLPGSDEIYFPIYSLSGPALFYNKKMLVGAGLVDENGEAKPPTTWSELLEYAEILTTDSTFGIALPMQWDAFAEDDILWPGANTVEEGAFTIDWDELTVTFNVSDPVEVIAEIYQNGYCIPGAETIDNETARSYFSEGVSGMFLGFSWDIGVFTSQYVADFDWGICELSAEDGSNYGVMNMMSKWYMPTRAAADLSEEDQEKLMRVIEWLWGDEVGTTLVEEGLIFPANEEFIEKADASLISDVEYELMTYLADGRIDSNNWNAWENIRNNVDYDGAGAYYLDDQVIRVSQGEITADQFIEEANSAFTAALRLAVEEGDLDPEAYK